MKVYVTTGNKNKIKEIRAVLAPFDLEVELFPGFSEMKIVENGSTFEENASIKAEALSKIMPDVYVIADDSGIEVKYLNGKPGVHSARYAGEDASDKENNRLLLKEMAGVEDREAAFVCVIALAKNSKVEKLFRGECKGKVADSPKGSDGFGYDPIFLLPDGRSMAELKSEEKNKISHRYHALIKLSEYLKNRL